jgi:quercetin dioxygenase-like cupin family protein
MRHEILGTADIAGQRREVQVNTKTRLILGAAGAAVAIVGVAFATPIVGLTSPPLAVGSHNDEVHARGTAQTSTGERFKVELETEGPATFSTQDGAIAAGGHNGWHSHPGMVMVTLISGSIEWYDDNCAPTVYSAGDSWVEGSQPHAFKVLGNTGIHLIAWFISAQGQALRTDQPAPACVASLGL